MNPKPGRARVEVKAAAKATVLAAKASGHGPSRILFEVFVQGEGGEGVRGDHQIPTEIFERQNFHFKAIFSVFSDARDSVDGQSPAGFQGQVA